MFLPEYQKGNGFSGVKAFGDKTGLDDFGKKLLRKTLKPLSDKLNIIVKGDGLILIPKNSRKIESVPADAKIFFIFKNEHKFYFIKASYIR